MDTDKIVYKAWEDFRKNFYAISLGVLLSVVVAGILFWFGYQLLGKDWVVIFLVNSFLLGGIYVATRAVIEPYTFEDSSLVLARFVLAFSVFTLFLILSILMPYPIHFLFLLLVVSFGYLAVPIVAELGIEDGMAKVAKLSKKAVATYVGLNWFFLLGFLAVVSLFIHPILIGIGILALLFLYYPVYSLTAYYLAKTRVR